MLARTLKNYMRVQQNLRFSRANIEKSPAPPTIGQVELEPFKFNHERDQLIYGYTMEELYGKKFGLKHSATILREIKKDTIMMILFVIGGFTYCYHMRETRFQLDDDFNEYVNTNKQTFRPIPDHVKI
ncbi:hypothetical protein ABPG74_017442 [Tetrahymena malaccensis]